MTALYQLLFTYPLTHFHLGLFVGAGMVAAVFLTLDACRMMYSVERKIKRDAQAVVTVYQCLDEATKKAVGSLGNFGRSLVAELDRLGKHFS